MAKQSTGAVTVYESMRLSLKQLQKEGRFKAGCISTGPSEWTKGGEWSASIGVECCYLPGRESYIKLTYGVTDGTGKQVDYCYKIDVVEVPSNLGKGTVLYMICPVTGKKCRILYMAYGSRTFKSREAYLNEGKRLYYDCQIASQVWRYNDCYWRVESHLEKIGKFRKEYAGKETRTYTRVQRLWEKQFEMDQERWHGRGVPKALRGHIL